MNQTAEIMARAESMGIRIYYQGGLRVDVPWPIGAMPDPARHALGELKKRQPAVLAYLANVELAGANKYTALDFGLQLDALRALGIHLAYDAKEEIKIHCKPILDEHLQVAGVLLDSLLRNHYREMVEYLKDHPQPAPAPG